MTSQPHISAAVTLPWPSRSLHPNARVHWRKKAKATKAARHAAAWEAIAAGFKPMQATALSVTATFFPPDERLRDLDSLLSSLKAAFDGIADIIGVDDSRWTYNVRRGPSGKPGCVKIEVEPIG